MDFEDLTPIEQGIVMIRDDIEKVMKGDLGYLLNTNNVIATSSAILAFNMAIRICNRRLEHLWLNPACKDKQKQLELI